VFGFFLVVLLLVGAFMAVVILLQAGKGGGLASMGGGAGTDTLIGGRQAATLLTKATWVSGGLFLTLALVLSILSSRQAGPSQSILRGMDAPPPASTGQPILPGTQSSPQQQPAPGTGTQQQTPAPATTGQ
jgi:preprotein translocase subunit SecG